MKSPTIDPSWFSEYSPIFVDLQRKFHFLPFCVPCVLEIFEYINFLVSQSLLPIIAILTRELEFSTIFRSFLATVLVIKVTFITKIPLLLFFDFRRFAKKVSFSSILRSMRSRNILRIYKFSRPSIFVANHRNLNERIGIFHNISFLSTYCTCYKSNIHYKNPITFIIPFLLLRFNIG